MRNNIRGLFHEGKKMVVALASVCLLCGCASSIGTRIKHRVRFGYTYDADTIRRPDTVMIRSVADSSFREFYKRNVKRKSVTTRNY